MGGMFRTLRGLAEHLLWAVVGAVARGVGMVLGRLGVFRQQLARRPAFT
jgi:hypothetical protein